MSEKLCAECGTPVCEHGHHGCAGADPEQMELYRKALDSGFASGQVKVKFTLKFSDPDKEEPGIESESCWAEVLTWGEVKELGDNPLFNEKQIANLQEMFNSSDDLPFIIPGDEENYEPIAFLRIKNILVFTDVATLDDIVWGIQTGENYFQYMDLVQKNFDRWFIHFGEDGDGSKEEVWKGQYRKIATYLHEKTDIRCANPRHGYLTACWPHGASFEVIEHQLDEITEKIGIPLTICEIS